ncbi:hypothetical protein WR25_24698 [Diploscapter pachys]|uniref:Uncharacterized protein n=1 Tax=Diploscapter pachys TaxID=2018661 RepID=A0A2A2L5R7_9BILA|nr:hypothetical protein WR25_24698 [Diploscapter pachys]
MLSRVFVVLLGLIVACFAYGRLEMEDRLAMSKFHESSGPEAYNRYLSDLSVLFSRPERQHAENPETNY